MLKTLLLASTALILSARADRAEIETVETGSTASIAFFAAVDDTRIQTASGGEEWLTYGGTYDKQRHSTLDQINRDTIVWFTRLGSTD